MSENNNANVLAELPTLFIQTGKEQSALFAMNFARDVRHFVLRLTGGCGLMSPQDAVGLQNLTDALSGRLETAADAPRFAGFGLFGGSRMLMKSDLSQVVPGVTEVFPAIRPYCPDATALGVVAKVADLKYAANIGLVVHDEPNNDFFTILHPTQKSVLLLQPTADAKAIWDDEYRECVRFCSELHKLDWQSLLVVYNGGGTVRKEVEAWAKLGKSEPGRWNILLVKGSGRVADEFANDEEFLAEHANVHVAENNVEDLRRKLTELGALVPPRAR